MQVRTKSILALAVVAIAALALAACTSASSSAASSASGSSASSGSTEPSSASGSAASSDAPSQSSSDVDVLDASDTVFISLDYNAGTGYQWTYTADPEGVLVETDKTTESRAEEGVAGGPLRDTYTFRAQSPGDVVLTFNLVRPWETDEQPAETQVYAFTVTKYSEVNLDRDKSDFKLEPDWITYS